MRAAPIARPRQPLGERLLLLLESYGDLPLDRLAELLQSVRPEALGRDRGLARHHPAADVHADGRRTDGALRRDDASHGRTNAQVDIGHRGHVVEHEGQRRRVLQLFGRLRLDRVSPDFDRDPGVENGFDRHRAVSDRLSDSHRSRTVQSYRRPTSGENHRPEARTQPDIYLWY